MKKIAGIFAIFVSILLPAQALAGFTIGNLLDTCMAHKRINDTGRAIGADKIMAGQCQGFIMGVVDGFMFGLIESGVSKPKSPFCAPSEWNVKQGSLVFLKWAEEHPEHLNALAAEGVILSHIAAFPCS